MIEYSLSVPEWLKLSADTRVKLAEIFQIPKSKGAMVEQQGEGSVVRSDGHTHEDLQAITVEKMKTFLGLMEGSEPINDFVKLFNAVIVVVEKDKELEVVDSGPDVKTLLIEEWIAILNRLKGQSLEREVRMEKELEIIVKKIFNIKDQIHVENAGLPAKAGRPKKVK